MPRAQGLRQKKNAKVKNALYKAAMELFRQKGFEATSIEEIVERAGFSRATFFNHFGTKQGVLRCYGQQVQSRVEELLERTDPDASPLELVRTVLFAMVSEAEANRDDLRLICTHSVRDPNYMFEPTPARKRIFEVFTELVEKAQRRGETRQDIPPYELALHILFLYQGVVLAIITDMGHSESLLQSAWQFILKGVSGENSPAR